MLSWVMRDVYRWQKKEMCKSALPLACTRQPDQAGGALRPYLPKCHFLFLVRTVESLSLGRNQQTCPCIHSMEVTIAAAERRLGLIT